MADIIRNFIGLAPTSNAFTVFIRELELVSIHQGYLVFTKCQLNTDFSLVETELETDLTVIGVGIE